MMSPVIVRLPMRHTFGIGDSRNLSLVKDMEGKSGSVALRNKV